MFFVFFLKSPGQRLKTKSIWKRKWNMSFKWSYIYIFSSVEVLTNWPKKCYILWQNLLVLVFRALHTFKKKVYHILLLNAKTRVWEKNKGLPKITQRWKTWGKTRWPRVPHTHTPLPGLPCVTTLEAKWPNLLPWEDLFWKGVCLVAFLNVRTWLQLNFQGRHLLSSTLAVICAHKLEKFPSHLALLGSIGKEGQGTDFITVSGISLGSQPGTEV